AHTQALWTSACIKPMVKRCYNQANCATVDVAKGMTSDLLVGWANISTGGTAYAAQCLFKMRISSHLTAPIINKHNMHLFVRCRGTGNKCGIACNVLGRGTACQQT